MTQNLFVDFTFFLKQFTWSLFKSTFSRQVFEITMIIPCFLIIFNIFLFISQHTVIF